MEVGARHDLAIGVLMVAAIEINSDKDDDSSSASLVGALTEAYSSARYIRDELLASVWGL